MQEDEENELDARNFILSEFESFNETYFSYWKDIDYSRRQMINFIDDLVDNLSVLVPENVYPTGLEDEPRQIKASIDHSAKEFKICLLNSFNHVAALSDMIILIDEDFNNYWWTLGELVYWYTDKLQKLHLEFLRVRELFDKMVQKYAEMCGIRI
ncbi:hypothetical protein AVEN_49511-1 [Araneus ventricosus]|uniref:Uncharacterized protein n=1 Tax=Araneus ventricosus TaxID=182803 RepID=A0A4Y2PX47_ARAVE|nr:hypothetical protein AVEN_49511-1 [Araneus ventricosus]